MICGSPIFVSFFVILIRKRAFESIFSKLFERYKTKERNPSNSAGELPQSCLTSSFPIERRPGIDSFSQKVNKQSSVNLPHCSIPGDARGPTTTTLVLSEGSIKHFSTFRGQSASGIIAALASRLKSTEGLDELENGRSLVKEETNEGLGDLLNGEKTSQSAKSDKRIPEEEKLRCQDEPEKVHPNTTRQGGVCWHITPEHNWPDDITISRSTYGLLSRTVSTANSQLSRDERMQLGGAEYRVIKLLAYLIPTYFIIWQLLGCLSVSLYIAHSDGDVADAASTNPWYV
jgi:hypothetical protein